MKSTNQDVKNTLDISKLSEIGQALWVEANMGRNEAQGDIDFPAFEQHLQNYISALEAKVQMGTQEIKNINNKSKKNDSINQNAFAKKAKEIDANYGNFVNNRQILQFKITKLFQDIIPITTPGEINPFIKVSKDANRYHIFYGNEDIKIPKDFQQFKTEYNNKAQNMLLYAKTGLESNIADVKERIEQQALGNRMKSKIQDKWEDRKGLFSGIGAVIKAIYKVLIKDNKTEIAQLQGDKAQLVEKLEKVTTPPPSEEKLNEIHSQLLQAYEKFEVNQNNERKLQKLYGETISFKMDETPGLIESIKRDIATIQRLNLETVQNVEHTQNFKSGGYVERLNQQRSEVNNGTMR